MWRYMFEEWKTPVANPYLSRAETTTPYMKSSVISQCLLWNFVWDRLVLGGSLLILVVGFGGKAPRNLI